MDENRFSHLETRVAVVETQVSEIKQGMVQVHADLRENNRMTQEIKDNTDSLVKAGQAVAWLIKFFGWIGVVATGVAGIFYLLNTVQQ